MSKASPLSATAPPSAPPRSAETSRPVFEKRPPAPIPSPDAGQMDDDPLPPGAVTPDAGYASGQEQSEAPLSDAPPAAATPSAVSKPGSPQADAFHKKDERPVNLRNAGGAKPRGFAERIREATSGASNLFPTINEGETQEIPWERPDKFGVWGGLYHTVLRVLFGAPRFFAALAAATPPMARPVVFYIILGMFQTVAKLIWFNTVDPSITDPRVQELLSSAAQGISVPMTLLLAPGLLVAQLFLYSGLFYLMLRLVQPERAVFSLVLRVVAYSSAPMVLSLVPFIGPVVAPFWFAICCFIGCKYALKIGWHQVALALVPLYLIAFAIAMQLVQRLLAQG